jgi:AcrR family transcriptional regulator
MPRHHPSSRLRELVNCATRTFIEKGYKNAQMDDVAKRLGVAKGTLYVYVDSKDALFDLVVRCADREELFAEVPRLPIPTPKRGATIAYVRHRLAENQTLLTLATALSRTRGAAPRGEFEKIVSELYDTVERNRYGLKLLDRTAQDQPELAALWFEGARDGLLAALSEYLKREIRRGTIKEIPDASVAARFIIETVVFWGVHRYWDPHPQDVDDVAARETATRLIVNSLVGE